MSQKLDDLSMRMRPMAVELLARCVEARIDVRIIDTLRTPEEHAANVARGVSWTSHSKHLDGDAIDIAPVVVLSLPNWAPEHPAWNVIGRLGEQLGLTWGGRWKRQDCCHFEVKNDG